MPYSKISNKRLFDNVLNRFYVEIIINFLCILFVTSFFAGTVYAEDRKNKILVLHSYHQGLEWTDNITQGIVSIFSPLHELYEIHYEYLDTKRNVGEEYMHKMVSLLLEKNKKIKYKLIITSDNNALKLIKKHRSLFLGNPPVVFCGINNYNKSLIDGVENITGVVETTDHKGTIELSQKLHPERNQILVVLDKTPTGEAIREEFKEIEKFYEGKIEFEFFRDFSLDEVPQKLSRLDDNHLIYILTFNRDRNNNFISYAEGIKMFSKNTDVPIYGSWDFYLGKGIVGGRITSGYLQGQQAAKLALKILHNDRPGDIDVVLNCPTQFMFDYNYLYKFGISPSLLPKASIIINSPPDLQEKYKNLLLFIALTSFCLALVYFWKYKKQKQSFLTKKALALELEKKVSERTEALEIANKELEKLSNIDGLTQLYNRRYFDQELKRAISRSKRTSSSISLLMCDIDFFKNYNDFYGHLSGDECIQSFAGLIKERCRRISDIPSRYGGEEFCIILPDTNSEGALKIAESIRKDLEDEKIPHSESPIKDVVSVSIGGVSIIPGIDTTPSMMISLADKALYESKKNGRDRITFKQENG